MVWAFIEKNSTAVVRIMHARSFTVLIEMVHRSMGRKPELFNDHYCMYISNSTHAHTVPCLATVILLHVVPKSGLCLHLTHNQSRQLK